MTDRDSQLWYFRGSIAEMEIGTYIDARIPSRDRLYPNHRKPSFLSCPVQTRLPLHAQRAQYIASLSDALPHVTKRSQWCRLDRKDQFPLRAVILVAIRGLDLVGRSEGKVRTSVAVIYTMR